MLSRWPIETPYFDGKSIHPKWQRWLSSLVVAVNACPSIIGSVGVSSATAAVVTTAIPAPAISAGLYRLTYATRKTVVGATSIVTVTLGWTDAGVACTKTFAAFTTNAVNVTDSGTWMINADANTTITYAIAYGSTGTALTYDFELTLEAMSD